MSADTCPASQSEANTLHVPFRCERNVDRYRCLYCDQRLGRHERSVGVLPR